MKELWKDVVGYEGLYEVSNLGNVRNAKTKKQLKPQKHERGYLRVTLCKNKKHKLVRIHKLVMIAFVGYEEGKQVNHIDGNKANNRLDNLEYCTQSENMKHAYANGLVKSKRPHRKVRCVELDRVFKNASEASRVLGFDTSGILGCCHGVYNTIFDLHFEFVD